MTRVWKTGEAVQITCEGRTLAGTVQLASPNGAALTLEFEGILAGHVAMLPVLWNVPSQEFRSLFGGVLVELAESQQEGA